VARWSHHHHHHHSQKEETKKYKVKDLYAPLSTIASSNGSLFPQHSQHGHSIHGRPSIRYGIQHELAPEVVEVYIDSDDEASAPPASVPPSFTFWTSFL
jgi:hypothetical protein